jgi:hypothetical protein
MTLKRVPFTALFILLICFTLAGQESWQSRYIKTEYGRIVPAADEKGNIIPDFSRVGYHKGQDEIPEVRIVKTITAPAAGDSHELIQNAIDDVAKMAPDAKGIRGAILIKKGIYMISGTLRINSGGIVLRGEGQAEAGTVLVAAGEGKRTLLVISGKSAAREMPGTRVNISDKYVPAGSYSFNIENPEHYKSGDEITILRPGTEKWIHDLKMDNIEEREGTKQWAAKDYDLRFEREIIRIEGKRIWVDQPVVMAMESAYGGGIVYRITNDRISENGVENILFRSEYASDTDENHGWYAIEIDNCEHGWVRNVTSRYFGNGCVAMRRGSKYITVGSSKCFDAKSQITGGRRYSFSIDGQMCLVMNCEATEGRHDFVTGSRVSGPNVFFNCKASGTHADIGPHHRWSTGTLYDNIITDGEINVQDRGNWGSGHGWAGANQVLWNCTVKQACVQNPWVSAKNWCIGLTGLKSSGRLKERPDGEWEGLNRKGLTPSSLYIAQLKQSYPERISSVTADEQVVKGRLIFSDDFRSPQVYTSDFQPLKEGWKVRAWHPGFRQYGEGLESVWKTGHNPVLAYKCSLHDVIIEVDFRYIPDQIPDSNAYCRINLSNLDLLPRSYLVSTWVNSTAKNRSLGLVLENEVWPPGAITTVASANNKFEPGKWYTVKLEVAGDFARLTCNGNSISGRHEQFGVEKRILSVGVGKSPHQLRNLRVYEAILKK